ncbi:MAG TPA: tetratricopeptide repeat-containing glycosyltransferase family protein [Ferrovibrio sp.]|uniref:tetratricopeptide repeat-containing glycosyltransferase family protein n=1 Tax=Ferrovibrio sp. TaxID=1917215 RepID=UPI002B4ACC0D|nr:tetratricopeptide repeat-containing glycosyltransferase family protein [Ferrovibrio sp.]HLT76789.1 tetratricopeptide repeat-containing glycosyltransferase family protein [Ferrovibrio sp.]
MNRKQRRAQDRRAAAPMRAGSVPPLPQEAARLNEQALAFFRAGQLPEAIAALRRAVALAPRHGLFHSNLGELLRLSGDTTGALDHLDRAVTLDPDNAGAHSNRGNLLRQLGRPDEAIASYRTSLRLRPGSADTLVNLGAALQDVRDFTAAIDVLRQAIALNPGLAMAHQNLGLALMAQGDLAGAEAAVAKAAELSPAGIDTLIALGDLERGKGSLDGALRWYEKAWRQAPGHGEAHMRYGAALMIRGNYGQAWPHFEARWNLAEMAVDRRPFTLPFWKGEPIPADRKMLLFTEQGVGENLVLLSVLPELLACGITPVIECDPRMIPLLNRSFPGIEVHARKAPPEPRLFAGDLVVQATLFDVAAVFRRSPADCKGALPLRADPQRTAMLRQRYLAGHDGPLVGIAWHSGNPKLGAPKSAQLTDFAPFLTLPGIRFVDLQYGNRAEDRAALKAACGADILHDPGIDQLKDLDGFAAQVAAMDMVISTSNTTAHMAGALGRPTWVLLHKGISPHWYWGLEGETTPWYPTLRLLRQSQAADWRELAEKVAAELPARLASTTS